MKEYVIVYERWDDFELHWTQSYRTYTNYRDAHRFMLSLNDDPNCKNAVGPLIKAESIDKPEN